MMDLGKTFNRDEDKVTNGVWFDVGDGARIKVAYWKNENFVKYISQQTSELDELPDDVREDVSEEKMAEGLSKHILVDWEGIEINGEPTEYSQEVAKEVLLKLPEFTELVISRAQDLSAFRDEETEVDIKN